MRHALAAVLALLASSSPLLAGEPIRIELSFNPTTVAVGEEAELRVALLDQAGQPVTIPRDLSVQVRTLVRTQQAGQTSASESESLSVVVAAGGLETKHAFIATDEGAWVVEASAEGLYPASAALVVSAPNSSLETTTEDGSPSEALEARPLERLPANGNVVLQPEWREYEPAFDGSYSAQLTACWFQDEQLQTPPRALDFRIETTRARQDVRLPTHRLSLTPAVPCTAFKLWAEEPGEVVVEVVWEGRTSRRATVVLLPPARPDRLRFTKSLYRQEGVRSVNARIEVELVTGNGKPWMADRPYQVNVEVEGHSPALSKVLEITKGASRAAVEVEVNRLGSYLLSATSDGVSPAARVALHAEFDDELLWWCLGGGLLAATIQAFRAEKNHRRRQFRRSALPSMIAAGCAFLLAHWKFFEYIESNKPSLWVYLQTLTAGNEIAILLLGLLAGLGGDLLFKLIETTAGHWPAGFKLSALLPKGRPAK